MSPAPCAACSERRLRPESLAVKIAGLSIADFTGCRSSDARAAVDKIRAKLTLVSTKSPDAPGRNRRAPRFSSRCRPGYLSSGPFRRHAFRRRSAAHSPGHANRLASARRAVRARRTLHRPARARQRPPAQHARNLARPRQYRPRRRARRRNHPPRRITWWISAPAPAKRADTWSPPARPKKSPRIPPR